MTSTYGWFIMVWKFYCNAKGVNISPHFIIDCVIMSGTNISLSGALNLHMVFPAVHLHIAIFKVTEDM